MSNKITYPMVGGIIKNMKGDAAITAGMYVAVTADNTVDEATGVIHGIVLDAPKSGVSPSTGYTVSVLLFGNAVIKAPTDITAVAGNYLKADTGDLADDGAALTVNSIALVLDAGNDVILIL